MGLVQELALGHAACRLGAAEALKKILAGHHGDLKHAFAREAGQRTVEPVEREVLLSATPYSIGQLQQARQITAWRPIPPLSIVYSINWRGDSSAQCSVS